MKLPLATALVAFTCFWYVAAGPIVNREVSGLFLNRPMV